MKKLLYKNVGWRIIRVMQKPFLYIRISSSKIRGNADAAVHVQVLKLGKSAHKGDSY
jgi:hypothetical protein